MTKLNTITRAQAHRPNVQEDSVRVLYVIIANYGNGNVQIHDYMSMSKQEAQLRTLTIQVVQLPKDYMYM